MPFVIDPPLRPGNGEAVFIVDDMKTIRELVSLQLEHLGCQPVAFESAEQCLEALTTREPRLILMDLVMDPMRGDECCQKIKENQRFAHIPIVMLTGTDAAPEIMHSWRAGADDYLPKPIRLPQLASKIEALRTLLPAPDGSQTRTLSRRRLVYVENRLFYRTRLGGALEHAGFQIRYCKDGSEALRALATHHDEIGLLLCDLGAMGADGFEGARRLCAQVAGKTPVLLMTASDPPPEIQSAVQELTGHELLNKRFLPAESILAKVNSLLNRATLDVRPHERVPFFSVVEFRANPNDDWLSGFAYDISTGGIFIRTMTPFPPLSSIQMKVRFFAAKDDLRCQGVVAWANAFNSRSAFSYPLGMGVRFSELDPEAEKMVNELVRSGGRNAAW